MRLTIGQFQELYRIDKSKDDEIDKAVRSVSCMTGLTRWEVEDMDYGHFLRVVDEVETHLKDFDLDMNPKKYFKVNGKKYGINYDASKIKAGQYVELQHFMKGDIVENLHYLMASIVYPVTFWRKGRNKSESHQQVAEDMLDVDFREAYASVVFFCKIWNASIEAIRDFLISETKAKIPEEELIGLMKDLQIGMDGYSQQERLQTLN
jgi:hypothetical protein